MLDVQNRPAEEADTGAPDAAGTTPPDGLAPAPLRPYLVLAAVLCGLYFLYSWAQYATFRTPSWDLGIFGQSVRAYAEFRAPVVDIKGPGFHILGDHFSPVTALLAPLYWVWSSPVALLFAQAALFALGAVIVGRTTQQILGSRAAGIGLALAYGLSWGLQEAVKSDFHEIAFAVPMLALTCRALLLGRWTAAAAWAAPLVLVKEDMGLTVSMVGVVLFLKGQKRLGAALAGFGAAAFALTVLVLIPAASRVGEYDYWSKIEKTGQGTDTSFVQVVGDALGSGERWQMVFYLLAITGFLALRSPLVLLVLPTLGWRFLSQDPNHWGMHWHYSAILMPVVFLALVDGVRAVRTSPRAWLSAYGKVVVPVATAVALVLAANLPLWELTKPETYRSDARAEQARAAVDAVPEGASVEADVSLLAHLTADHRVYWVGTAKGATPDYLAFDLRGWSQQVSDPELLASQLHPEARYEITHRSDGFAVLKRA
ncbi:DUF2079 domain-containing protein [Streptomyces sp. adm13(2018)]|uniref:DUF2079 domain-containing protein n=1 Tax=Streptomyces sp. adm13(2018) TaxID=2479007 RepID=UPI0011CD591B|nr:DUF2079 domain-containing protein [Streptomyces sp. adm13(2018)]TXS11915.1 DUF2079 domain-containing protein [Streptomyces sp. adm13(2018)]